ncbi:hypothetical protein BJV82DRAFT_612937 [Fennellomyces sp. T-0311]|nr:hypothetical protein BJV82DRAFT_612937 [Fennellomyces sp. T-0311]
MATIADCTERDFTDQKRSEMTFSEFVNVWQGGRYYLKDWHFVRAFPEYNAYTVPHVFEDDWMNEYWLKDNKDDYRFVYMGGDGTFTPLHADVFRSYSWSSNICGVKKWTLFPPGQEQYLKDRLGNYAYDLRQVDPDQFPNIDKAIKITLYQREGETLFVPSGWFHQVENIGATISINHNWSNACNLGMTFRSLCDDLNDVERSIDDVRQGMSADEFTHTCQHLLLVHSGWDWSVFFQMLHCITKRLHDGGRNKHQPDVKWQAEQIDQVLHQRNKEVDRYLDGKGLGTVIPDIEAMIKQLKK